MPIVHIRDLDDSRVDDYRNVADAELLRRRGLFVAEGRLVVERLLTSKRYPVRSLLVTETALAALDHAVTGLSALPIYVCDLAVMRGIVGFNIHRGCLAIGERRAAPSLKDLLAASRVILLLESIRDADNVGGIFRNAAALGGDAMLLSPGCCDPLYRKSIRTSMGSALTLPHAWLREWPEDLRTLRAEGFTTVALTPAPDAIDIDSVASPERLAVLLGNESEGLSAAALTQVDRRVRIPIRADVDSLNVATAAAIALHRLVTTARLAASFKSSS
jgi:tRNA G18 (ribose-2'-O)-methylase SpoU